MTTSFEDHFLATRDGLRLHYRSYAPVGVEIGPPVLCLHGLTRNLLDFEDLAPQIAAQGRRVITMSQRGRGLSDRDPKTENYAIPNYVGDMWGAARSSRR